VHSHCFSASMPGLSSAPTLQRGVGTPPPTRPRLFARISADRKSPPPPARLAPITRVTTPVTSPEPTPQLCGEAEVEEEVRHKTPERSATWWFGEITTTSSFSQHQQSLPQTKVLLTPPRSGSGNQAHHDGSPVATEGSAETQNVDWTGCSRAEPTLTAKRERFISSADTQHSMASSSTPPPRCRRAVNDHDNNRTPTRTTSYHHHHHPRHGERDSAGAVAEDSAGVVSTHKLPERHDRLQLSGSTSRSSSSRGAISEISSSDFVATVATAVMTTASSEGVTGTSMRTASTTSNANTTTAATQCLVLDDRVDAAAIMPTDQLQRLLERAAAEKQRESREHADDTSSTPYRCRVITAEVLRDWTGWEDLELVRATQLRVDAEAMIGVEQIGRHLPQVSSLKLNGSRIPRLRQLGTGFHALKFLWLNSCHLSDLRGLAACCPALVELYVSFNCITDVTPVVELSATLEVLDVEGNLIDDATSLGFVLSSLQKLTSLSLVGNPITCECQSYVRAAYAAALADVNVPQDREAVTTSTASPLSVRSQRFTDVLRGWVRYLMPHLQTLNDEPMQLADEGTEPESLEAVTTTSGAVAATTAVRVPSTRAVHVDPLDEHLAEELRLVEACVREMDPFDSLLEAVEEANQLTYTRPSTSCNGARPRLTPATAMGASRPSTSARSASSAAMSYRVDSLFSGDGAAAASTKTDASVLTTGAVLAGSAIASLRRRLATPTPTPSTSSLDGAAVGGNSDGEPYETTTAATAAAKVTSTRLGEHAHQSCNGVSVATLGEEDARVAALLAVDSDEDEWERYKASLLLSPSVTASTSTAATAVGLGAAAATVSNGDSQMDAPALKRPSLFSLASAAPSEDDGFDEELRSEWTRLRARMAKAGRTR
jgi:hypothetical protein